MSATPRSYYNDNDPHAAAWLRGLVTRGLIAAGDVDERSIHDVRAADLVGYTQCHFFAGIGGWSYALRLAGWPDDEPVWTGSCPCQPFSAAGLRKGKEDPRHLAPVWLRLISECRPRVLFGEQVEDAIADGWLDDLAVHLERCGYAVGAAVLPAAGVGAPHARHRLYFVADADGGRLQERGERHGQTAQDATDGSPRWADVGGRGEDVAVGDTACEGPQGQRGVDRAGEGWRERLAGPASEVLRVPWQDAEPVRCADGERLAPAQPALFPLADGLPGRVGLLRGAGNAITPQVAAAFIRAYREVRGER